jgi:ribosome biogenesis GTPase A
MERSGSGKGGHPKRRSKKAGEWSFLKDMIHGADVIVEVVDARDIAGTRLPMIERMAGSRRLLMVANKLDLLAEGARLPKLANGGFTISSTKANESQRRALIGAIKGRTQARPARALLLGYPNVGKSTLINMLAQRKAARVSPVAGTTKDIQWISITSDLTVSDYRGVYPKHEKKDELVRKGAMDVRGNEEGHAHTFAQKIIRSTALRQWMEKEFDLSLGDAHSSEDVLAALARRRKLYVKGGELNIDEAARVLIRAMKDAPEI